MIDCSIDALPSDEPVFLDMEQGLENIVPLAGTIGATRRRVEKDLVLRKYESFCCWCFFFRIGCLVTLLDAPPRKCL
jgi:hypothetical protein